MSVSESFDKTIIDTSEQELYVAPTWVSFWAQLESAAGGDNFISYGASFVKIEPGTVIQHVVAPQTKIQIRTTSTNPVIWSVLITQLTVIDDVLQALCG